MKAAFGVVNGKGTSSAPLGHLLHEGVEKGIRLRTPLLFKVNVQVATIVPSPRLRGEGGRRPDEVPSLLRCFLLDILWNKKTAGLSCPEFGVDAVFLLDQLGVGAFFDDFAFVHDDQTIHGGDG